MKMMIMMRAADGGKSAPARLKLARPPEARRVCSGSELVPAWLNFVQTKSLRQRPLALTGRPGGGGGGAWAA